MHEDTIDFSAISKCFNSVGECLCTQASVFIEERDYSFDAYNT